MIAGIYVRISQDREDEGLGVQRQEQDCQKVADQKGWKVREVYRDNDVSASTSKPRPAYERMMADLRAGTINAVIVWDVDRLTRQSRELEDFIDLADSHGVALANVSGDEDLSTDSGRLMARIKGAMARAESDKMSARLKRQKLQRAEQGKPPAGGRYRTFGYTRDWKIVPDEAAIIKDAFKRAILGESLQSIADHWTGIGVDMGNGKAVYFSTVNNVLKRHLYAGITVHNGVIMGKSQVPAIVDESTFNAVQEAMKDKPNAGPRGKNARVYLLGGLIRCGECLFPMGGGPTAKDKNGKTRHKYACRKGVGGCGTVSISGTAVERIVLMLVRQNLIVRGYPNKPARVDYQPEIDRLSSEIRVLQAAVKDGEMQAMDAIPIISTLSDQRRAVQRKEAEQVIDREEGFVGWDMFMEARISEQKALVNRVVSQVLVKKASGYTFNPERVRVHLVGGREVSGTAAMKGKMPINPLMIIDGFREKHRPS